MGSDLMALLRDPDEGPLLLPLVGGVADEAARRRYRDWLVARGDPRGELLDLLAALAAPTAPPDVAGLRARIAALSAGVPEGWIALFRATAETFNCGGARGEAPVVRFAYECPRRWESLAPTADPRVRRCDGCGEAVVRCDSLAEAEARAREGACITVPSRLVAAVHARYTRSITGRPHLPTVWGERIFGER